MKLGEIPVATALRRAFAKGYGARELRADVMAGAVVGIVALPLSMALAIAVGAPPQHGLYTAIVGGAIVALLGGCKFQVTGPTAAFVVVLAPIVTKHGLAGLMTAGFLAGLILVALGLAKLGSLIRFVPYPVTQGFTTGIATVIATLQLKDVLGLQPGTSPEHYLERVGAMFRARATFRVAEVVVAAATLLLLVYVPRVVKKFPAPLIAIAAVSVVAAIVHAMVPSFVVDTIGSRFEGGIPSALPRAALPWGHGIPSFAMVRELTGPAFAIAMLGAIESLLSGVIADGMTDTKHDPNAELVGLGVGNVLAAMFGGIAATGALARTATNIRAGAKSPIASLIHSLVVLLAMLLLAPLITFVPMASLAALLLVVAWNMGEVRHFAHVARVAPKSDVVILFTCFFLTVFFDMVVAVSVGFMLAAILFMKRMSDLTETRVTLDATHDAELKPPKGVVLYEINGPLFFGASQTAMATLASLKGDSFRVLVLHLGRVPVIDATGFVALENAIASVIRRERYVVLAGPLPKPRKIFDKANLEAKHPELRIAADLPRALALADELANGAADDTPRRAA